MRNETYDQYKKRTERDPLSHPDEDVRRMARLFVGLPVYPNREEIEAALDAGHVWVEAGNRGRWWRARRSGSTKLWKTRPMEFKIPFKIGMARRGQNGYFTYSTIPNFEPLSGKSGSLTVYKISSTDPNQK